MTKLNLALFAALTFSFFGCETSPTNSEIKKENNVDMKGKKVLYITKKSEDIVNPSDSITIAKLTEMGLNVVTIDADNSTADSAIGFDVIFISEVNSSASIGGKYQNAPVPILSCEHYVSDDMGWSSTETDIDFGKISGIKKLKIVNANHPAAAGFSGLVDIFSDTAIVGFSKPKGDVQIIATVPDSSNALIFAYEKGAKDINGNIIPARRISSYLFEGYANMQTEAGWKLIKYSVAWAMGII